MSASLGSIISMMKKTSKDLDVAHPAPTNGLTQTKRNGLLDGDLVGNKLANMLKNVNFLIKIFASSRTTYLVKENSVWPAN